MEALGYIASLFMGLTLGVMGGGGSILTVPILVYLFGVAPSMATGHSLFVVGLTALVGSVMAFRRHEVDFKVGFLFVVPSVIGVNISRGLILPRIPELIFFFDLFVLSKEILIMATFAVLMIMASFSMIKKKAAIQAQASKPHSRAISIGGQGLIVGLIAGFVGAGGGFLIIPALVLLAGLSMRMAIGTSLAIIATQSLLGFAGDLLRGADIHWSLLMTVAAIAILGIVAGSKMAHKMKEQQLKIAFGWFVLVMGASILIEQFRHLKG